MQILINIQDALKNHISKSFPGAPIPEEVFDWFINSGVVDKKSVLRMLIKNRYYDLLRQQKSGRSARLDCAIEFGVPETFVTETIYKHRDIKP